MRGIFSAYAPFLCSAMSNWMLDILLLALWAGTGCGYEWDDHGYVLYCPCMGRFGNQAAHFLGALRFAKELNRTLAVPPWRSYTRKANVPFGELFDIEVVQRYHKSLPLEEFMVQLAPQHWPPGERVGYCYRFTLSLLHSNI
ncbi:GDP-fucose protein O-fucosyltransferase 1 [Geodia barretti]|uniref:GDP-fucose protein O-fucosyltransferase 1 n=1 Tax=Geodia barretti TaxID=519541 RepID=A0AA35TKU5_GEOBA|nr:GDP-fucose protein O-fucosyltransferase 1 [Geodia barretti]